jgi:3',5'-cyclic AMP phosphodiesterase CpdA
MRDAIERTEPDLILLTGDIMYGEFDDKGTSLLALIDFMDSFGIPWAPVFGNHENESKMGAAWQSKQLESSSYCVFKRGETDGNGNYTVGIVQDGELVRVYYMMDSNGCGGAYLPEENNVKTSQGFTVNQMKWLKAQMQKVKDGAGRTVSGTLCFHIPSADYVRAAQKYTDQMGMFVIGRDVEAKNGDFGACDKPVTGPEFPGVDGMSFYEVLKWGGVDSTMVGHWHSNNTVITHAGITWAFGLKCSTYDSHTAKEIGGTLMVVDEDEFYLLHRYYDRAYEEEMQSLVYVPADAIKGLPVDGVNLKPNSGMSVSKTEVGGEYGYCFSSAGQAEMVIAPSLLRGHETFSMQVYIPSGSAKLKGLGEFTFRIQRSVGASSEYIQFGPEASGTHRFTYDTWCEITVDYSSYSSTVGLFNLVIPAGARLYIRNFSVEGEAAEIPEGSEKPADGAVSGLAYQGGFTVNNASLLKTVEIAGEVAYRYGGTDRTEIYFDTELLAGKTVLSFDLYVPASSCNLLNGGGLYTVRPKVGDLGDYLWYNETDAGFAYGTWMTVTVDLSKWNGDMTFLGIYLAPGNVLYFKNIALS